MAIGGENGESCEQELVKIPKGREGRQIHTSIVGPGHSGILVVDYQGSLTRPISLAGCHAVVSATTLPPTESRAATAVMSSVKGGYDEVEFLYSNLPYVFWISSGIRPGNR